MDPCKVCSLVQVELEGKCPTPRAMTPCARYQAKQGTAKEEAGRCTVKGPTPSLCGLSSISVIVTCEWLSFVVSCDRRARLSLEVFVDKTFQLRSDFQAQTRLLQNLAFELSVEQHSHFQHIICLHVPSVARRNNFVCPATSLLFARRWKDLDGSSPILGALNSTSLSRHTCQRSSSTARILTPHFCPRFPRCDYCFAVLSKFQDAGDLAP